MTFDALREALTADLQSRLGTQAPIVSYTWAREVETGRAGQVVMFAKLHANHRSAVVEASGADGDAAYLQLVERAHAWADGTEGESAPG